jgi:VIT1/CCC1 family predicted Fe2+/Mn2+ transporter
MRTQTVLCLLLNLAVGSASAEPPVTAAAMRVDPVVQRERDDARKTILEDELASEARQLADAQAELRGAKALSASAGIVDDIAERLARHRQNISELGREIALVERQRDSAIRNTDSAERRSMDTWLIRGRPSSSVSPEAGSAALSRRPLQSADGDERRKPGWLIPSGQTRTIP